MAAGEAIAVVEIAPAEGAPDAIPGDPAAARVADGDPVTLGPSDDAVMDDRERAAFQDPYALLARLAAEYKAKHPASADVVVGDTRIPGMIGGEADRDPFDPIYWQMAEVPAVRTTVPGTPGTAEAVSPLAELDAAAPETVPSAESAEVVLASQAVAEPVPAAPEPTPAPEPVAVMPPEPPPPLVPTTADNGVDAATIAEAAELGAELTESLKEALGETASPGISVTATEEGILINLIDDDDFSMFEIGSAIPDGKVVVILEEVAKALAARNGKVVVRGHTDGRPFRTDVYDNWRLSGARAHMAYYMLARGGLPEVRVERIEGYADRSLKNPDDPNAAENRRIEILLREATS
jgi:chemotaxis protein MotB